ncbi:MAG: LPXTG cell wall anchor domain-containing protein [Eubacteriales bacterium]|nr:LPXTG cell wall anchor domain-containing protein [Eubacteriales bacterium]
MRLGIISFVIGIVFVIIGILLKMNNNTVSVIGGADGPTSIFVATKLSSVSVNIFLIIGVVLLAAGFVLYFRKKNKR